MLDDVGDSVATAMEFARERFCCGVVLHGDDQKVTGVLVDAVQEVMRVSESQITASASSDAGVAPELCTRDDEFVSIVDMDRVLDIGADD